MADSFDLVIASAGHKALIGPGRNATQVLFENFGLDFERAFA